MKKTLIVALMFILLVSSFSFTAFADGPATVRFGENSIAVCPGMEFEVPVEIGNNPGVMVMLIPLAYDSAVVESISVEGTGMKGWDYGTVLEWDGAENSDFTGDAFHIKMKIRDDAAVGSSSLKFVTVEAYNYDEEEVWFEADELNFRVVDELPEKEPKETPKATEEPKQEDKIAEPETSASIESEVTEDNQSNNVSVYIYAAIVLVVAAIIVVLFTKQFGKKKQ